MWLTGICAQQLATGFHLLPYLRRLYPCHGGEVEESFLLLTASHISILAQHFYPRIEGLLLRPQKMPGRDWGLDMTLSHFFLPLGSRPLPVSAELHPQLRRVDQIAEHVYLIRSGAAASRWQLRGPADRKAGSRNLSYT